MASAESNHSDPGHQRAVAASSSNATVRPVRISSVRRKSYADWISRAIDSSPEGKLTLASIYKWMAANVPGLYEKRNLHSSKGWKNAVRHTLSVNRRFQKSSQPNARAALWSIAPPIPTDSDSSESPQTPSDTPLISSVPSCSPEYIPVTTCVTTPCLRSSSTDCSFDTNSLFPEPVITQRLELHHQDGTVRTVTVPKPFPIHVVGDYRLVTVDHKQHMPLVVTSGS